MNAKLLVGVMATTTLMLALGMLSANQATASSFPGENGQGHDRQTDCDHGPSGQDCPGKSEDADDHEECTTTFAGKSDNVKDIDCT